MVAKDYLLGVDIGSHLVVDPFEMDFQELQRVLDPKYCLIRQGQGTWRDPYYHELREQAEEVGMVVATWPVLTHENAIAQVVDWLDYVPDPGPLGRWVDYEETRDAAGKKRVPLAAGLKCVMERISAHDTGPVGVYTRAGIVDYNLGSLATDLLNTWWWWYAQYLLFQRIRGEFPPEYMRHAKRVDPDRVVILQTAGKLPAPPGVLPHASALDRDRWVGIMTLGEFMGPVAPPPLTLEERIQRLEGEARSREWDV